MSKLFEIKGYIMKYYSKHSMWIDKVLRFILSFLTFTYINQYIGFFEVISKPITVVILSVICMLLPMEILLIVATVVILIQIFMVSWGMAIVALLLFVILYSFYFRFSSGKTVFILLVPIAFMLQIPMVIPIAFGLIATPIAILPILAGTILHYVVQYVHANATLLQSAGETDLMKQVFLYAQQILLNSELWCTMLAFIVSLLLVYAIRKLSIDFSWEIAIVVGALANINVMAYGYIIIEIPFSYLAMIIGSGISILICLILKLFAFSVVYTRTEHLQFEDEEYYYYVKAVPKVSVAIREKKVKRITPRKRTEIKSSERTRVPEFEEEVQIPVDEE